MGEAERLDESLVISMSVSPNDEATTDKIPTNSLRPPEDLVTKSHITKPSFIKTMECSKFSTLIKAQESAPRSRPDYHKVKSTSSETPMSLGPPVSATEVAAALLGASTSSLCGVKRHNRVEEEDLSTPYNHYKSLSPKRRVGKLLRRQFSLDTTEEIRSEESADILASPKLCKQNSAGAADLEKIEEAPSRTLTSTPKSGTPPLLSTLSISIDSLLH